jgi:SAM-dependent methyltransferase
MLHYAARNIYPYNHRAAFIWAPAENLPFSDNSFDIVTCLEALEFMAQPEAVLKELVRVLRPGGLLLVSQRINTRFMPGKTWSSGQVLQLLEQNGIENPRAQIWQVDYRKVWGCKSGESNPIGSRPLSEVVCCPNCRNGMLKPDGMSSTWLCEACGKTAHKDADGVIELFPLYH